MKTRWPWALPWAHRWAGKANDVHGGEIGRSYRSVGDEIGSHCRGRGLRRAEKAGGALWAIPGHWAGLAAAPGHIAPIWCDMALLPAMAGAPRMAAFHRQCVYAGHPARPVARCPPAACPMCLPAPVAWGCPCARKARCCR
jgi:hypothetical protein